VSRRLENQIGAILESNGLPWAIEESQFNLRFASAVVHLSLQSWGTQTLIHLHSNVLRDVSSDLHSVLQKVNALNSDVTFGRWVYYAADRLLTLEHELLGDHLQEAELMTALASLARNADRYDDLLQADLGGTRATE
jgi:hypothetical protein